jgi:hypothetical protein
LVFVEFVGRGLKGHISMPRPFSRTPSQTAVRRFQGCTLLCEVLTLD